MAIITFPYKDPDEYLDYTLDWSARITTDPIFSSTWSTPTLVGSTLATTGISLATSSMTTSTTIVWISDGIIGSSYQFTNRISTTGGRILDQSCKLKIKSK